MFKVYKILLVGSGNLGIRYLQGMAEFNYPLEIFVFDIQKSSLVNASKSWDNTILKSSHKVTFIDSLEKLSTHINICIVTTTADVRLFVVQNIQKKIVVDNWILEKVLTQSVSDLFTLRDCFIGNHKVWVNIPRRMMFWHKRIKESLPTDLPLSFHLSGGDWGLACNTIHFIDLVSWWTGSNIIGIDTSGLHSWFPGKRQRFWEVSGKLVVNFDSGIYLELKSVKDYTMPLTLRIKSNTRDCLLNETEGRFYESDYSTISGKIEYQSILTSRLIKDILLKKSCDLPTLPDSVILHEPFLVELLKHWNHSNKSNDIHVPIT